jgi:hypothetical protein
MFMRLHSGECDQSELPATKKKADMVEHHQVFNHVGLLVNEPAAAATCPSSRHPTDSMSIPNRRPQPNSRTLRRLRGHHSVMWRAVHGDFLSILQNFAENGIMQP